MSFGNKNVDPNKVYSIQDLPPSKKCGGILDNEGVDTFWGKSLTKQADEKDANIQFILQKYEKTGILSAAIKENPQYGDFTSIPSYHEAQNVISKAHEQFEMLDPKFRRELGNDPIRFLDFVNDPKNRDRLIEMGLANKPVEPTSGAPTTPPPAPPAESV